MQIRLAISSDTNMLHTHDHHISRQELINSIQLNRIYLAEEAGEFLGWLRYNMFWDNTPFMNMLYVLEGSRGKGYGRLLVEQWEKAMRQLGHKVVLTSTASDEFAQHFYHKLGYTTIGGFTLENDPYEVILSKRLNED